MATKQEEAAAALRAEKMKALDLAVAEIEKQHGKGAIMNLGDNSIKPMDCIPSGSIGLDFALGVGGIPRGRIIEIYGPESSGKTTLTLSIVANAQKMGGLAAFVDAEHAFDAGYAKNCGVNINELLVSQPDSGEQALGIVETLVRSGALAIIIVDSVAALVPQKEIDGDMGDAQMGLQARLMSQALRKLTAITSKSGTTIIFINQLREKIGVMFGSPETTPGGKALKFYASVRLDIRKMESLKNGTEVYANKVRVKTVKNKVAPPFREAIFNIVFGKGVDSYSDLAGLAVERGIIEKVGNWFSYNGERIAHGAAALAKWLQEHTSAYDQIEAAVRANPGKLDALIGTAKPDALAAEDEEAEAGKE